MAAVPRRGVSMILREVSKGAVKPFAFPTMQHTVQRSAEKLAFRPTSQWTLAGMEV